MIPVTKIVFKKNLSNSTMNSLRVYLGNFLGMRHLLKTFDGQSTVYLNRPSDVEIIESHFPQLIDRVERANQ